MPPAKADWWPQGQWRHGDPFPLPLARDHAHNSGLPALLRDAWNLPLQQRRRVDDVVEVLNQLASARTNSDRGLGRAHYPASLRPTGIQSAVVASVAARVAAYGDPPGVFGARGSFRELCSSKDLYSDTPANLAVFDVAKLKVASGAVRPIDLRERLPPHVAAYLLEFRSLVERDQADVDRRLGSSEFPKPYWDPVLRGDAARRRAFLKDMVRKKIFGVRRAAKAFASVFFVKKKGKDSIRMVVDARAANFCHRRPPVAALGTPGSYAELLFDDGGRPGCGPVLDAHFAAADVQDCFYQFLVPQLASWFCFPDVFEAAELGVCEAFHDDAQKVLPLEGSERVYVCVEATSMGWSWSMFFAQEATSWIGSFCQPRGYTGLLRDRFVAPRPAAGAPVASLYVDNFTGIGVNRLDAQRLLDEFLRLCGAAGLPTHDVAPAARHLESVGLLLSGGSRPNVRHKPERFWKFQAATAYLMRLRTVRIEYFEIWLGHAVNLATLQRPILCCLDESYRALHETRGPRLRLSRLLRAEIRRVRLLLFLAEVDLAASFSGEVFCGDSSDYGYALVFATLSPDRVAEIAAFRERWRFVRGPEPVLPLPDLPEVVDDRFGLLPLPVPPEEKERLGECWSSPRYRGSVAVPTAARRTRFARWLEERVPADLPEPVRATTQDEALVEDRRGVPPLPAFLDGPGVWTTAFEGEWEHPEEHINVKEGRVTLMGLRRMCRVRRHHGKRILGLSDNLVSLLSFDKGRAKARPLNTLCRRAAALTLGCRIQWRLRHMPGARNPADEGSRRRESRRSRAAASKATAPSSAALPRENGVALLPVPPPVVRVTLFLADLLPPPGLGGLATPSRRPLRLEEHLFPRRTISLFDCLESLLHEPSRPARPRRRPKHRGGRPPSVPTPAQTPPRPRRKGRPRPAGGGRGSPRMCLELFGGVGGLSLALRKRGLAVAPVFELSKHPRFDLSRRSTQQKVLSWIRRREVWYVHIGVPCTIWSIARRGITNLGRAYAKERRGVHLALFARAVIAECSCHGVHWSVENPKSSRIWSFPPLAETLRSIQHHAVVFDMCQFSEPWKKPTEIRTSLPDLRCLGRRCRGDHIHTKLQGGLTARAGAYGPTLCAAWARAVARAAPADAAFTEEADEWSRNAVAELDLLVGPAVRKVCAADAGVGPRSEVDADAVEYLRRAPIAIGAGPRRWLGGVAPEEPQGDRGAGSRPPRGGPGA